MALTSGGAVVATTTTKFKTANAVTYLYDGQILSYGAADNVTVVAPTSSQITNNHQHWALYNLTTTTPAAASTFYVVAALDSAGAAVFFQGTYSGQDLTARGLPLVKGDGLIPQIPSGFVPFAIIKIAHSAAATFTWGTTALTTSGSRTVTFYNVGVLPSTTTL